VKTAETAYANAKATYGSSMAAAEQRVAAARAAEQAARGAAVPVPVSPDGATPVSPSQITAPVDMTSVTQERIAAEQDAVSEANANAKAREMGTSVGTSPKPVRESDVRNNFADRRGRRTGLALDLTLIRRPKRNQEYGILTDFIEGRGSIRRSSPRWMPDF